MATEIEIKGCITVPDGVTAEMVTDAFIEWVETSGWCFGGGFNTIIDGFYINPDGTRGRPVLDDC